MMDYPSIWQRIGIVALYAFVILAVLAGIACGVLKIVLVFLYKDVPLAEIPFWVYWWIGE